MMRHREIDNSTRCTGAEGGRNDAMIDRVVMAFYSMHEVQEVSKGYDNWQQICHWS